MIVAVMFPYQQELARNLPFSLARPSVLKRRDVTGYRNEFANICQAQPKYGNRFAKLPHRSLKGFCAQRAGIARSTTVSSCAVSGKVFTRNGILGPMNSNEHSRM